MNLLTIVGTVWLSLLFFVQVASAANGGPLELSQIPQWAIYVGLAVVCPEDLNRAIRERIGGKRDGD